MVGFQPKKTNRKKQMDIEKTRQDILDDEDDVHTAHSEEDYDGPFTQLSQSAPPKKKVKKDDADVETNNFSLEADEDVNEDITEDIPPVTFGSNLTIELVNGGSGSFKNSIEIKRTWVDGKGKERPYSFNFPRRASWGLLAALMKLMLADPEIVNLGKTDKNAVPRVKHLFNNIVRSTR